MNSCVIYGRLGQDAEFKQTPSGTSLLKFSVANNTGFGERKKTNWFNCTAWGERWENLSQYLKKGSAVVVSGEITLNEYETNSGETKASLSLNVREVTLAGGKADDEKPAKSAKKKDEAPSFEDDDIPY